MRSMSRQQAFTHAKKLLFHQGSHIPLIIVNTEGSVYIIPVGDDLLWNQGPNERMLSHFATGRAFGKDQCVNANEMISLFFIQEFWYVTPEDGPIDPNKSPSESEQRHEALGLLELVCSPEKSQSYYQCEILRNGGIVDLGPEEKYEATSGLLVAFLAGVASSVYSDQEFQAKTQRFLEVGEL